MAEAGQEHSADERTVIDAIADLLQTIVDWLRQEAEGIVREKIVALLGQDLGLTLAAAIAAASLVALGIGFIAVGLFMLLGSWIGYPYALLRSAACWFWVLSCSRS